MLNNDHKGDRGFIITCAAVLPIKQNMPWYNIQALLYLQYIYIAVKNMNPTTF